MSQIENCAQSKRTMDILYFSFYLFVIKVIEENLSCKYTDPAKKCIVHLYKIKNLPKNLRYYIWKTAFNIQRQWNLFIKLIDKSVSKFSQCEIDYFRVTKSLLNRLFMKICDITIIRGEVIIQAVMELSILNLYYKNRIYNYYFN